MTTALNPIQIHLLEMFSYAKTQEAFDDVKNALFQYFSRKWRMIWTPFGIQANGMMRKTRTFSTSI